MKIEAPEQANALVHFMDRIFFVLAIILAIISVGAGVGKLINCPEVDYIGPNNEKGRTLVFDDDGEIATVPNENLSRINEAGYKVLTDTIRFELNDKRKGEHNSILIEGWLLSILAPFILIVLTYVLRTLIYWIIGLTLTPTGPWKLIMPFLKKQYRSYFDRKDFLGDV